MMPHKEWRNISVEKDLQEIAVEHSMLEKIWNRQISKQNLRMVS